MTAMTISMNMIISFYTVVIKINEHRFEIIVTRNLKNVFQSRFTH